MASSNWTTVSVFAIGARVRIGDGATGVVDRLVNGSLHRVRYDHPDPLGNASGDYLADVLRPHSGKPRDWR